MMNSMIPWKRRDAEEAVAPSDQAPLSALRPNWDSLLEQFFGTQPSVAPAMSFAGPLLDISQTDEAIHVRAEVPGIAPGDLEIHLSGDVLTITGEKLQENEEVVGRRAYSERRFGKFSRSVRLTCPVEADEVSATHENGVLTVTLPKSAAARPKRIQIAAG